MKITDLKATIIGNSPVVRIVTDAGIAKLNLVKKMT